MIKEEPAEENSPYYVIKTGASKVRKHRRNKDTLRRLEAEYFGHHTVERLHENIDKVIKEQAHEFVKTLSNSIEYLTPEEVCRALGI